MTKQNREKMAQGISRNIGKKVISRQLNTFRTGEVAEIVGWGFENRLVYFIRFENGECDRISSNLDLAGYCFVDPETDS